MILAYWNALRTGDKVIVHDVTAPGAPLRTGHVAMVDAGRHPHQVGVQFPNADPKGLIQWPSRLRVHLDPVDRFDPCLWCAVTSPTS